MKNRHLVFIFFSMLACTQKPKTGNLMVYNAHIYTLDKDFTRANAMVIGKGKILAIGNYDSLKNQFQTDTLLDAQGKFIYPGFIDAHTHFLNYGQRLQRVNLVGTQSWKEILDSVILYSKRNPQGWLLGGGWDQNHWLRKEFPEKTELDSIFPKRPVVLKRVDGHALIANQAAILLAGVHPGQTISGGIIETIHGKLTGIFVDNAQKLIEQASPKPNESQIRESLLLAQKKCFSVGLTTVDECGLSYSLIEPIQNLQNSGDLKMRIYLMLSDTQENLDFLIRKGKIKTPSLNVRSFKFYADGALGSRGACLLKPYSDKPGWSGFLLSSSKHFEEMAKILYNKGFQMNTHAIGDSANRMILKVYAQVLKGKNDLRWRIEHSQIISPDDVHFFGDNSIIPSVQPTHATSDMFWAIDRLGEPRIRSAYAYKSLMKENGWIPLGTDFPVENINPLYTFYSAVVRKDLQGKPEKGFQMENALSRVEALKGMTIWAARANFEENEKGSLEPGKLADWIMLDQDIMTAKESALPGVKVLKTYLNGALVYNRRN